MISSGGSRIIFIIFSSFWQAVYSVQGCPSGWRQHGENCFFFSKRGATWEQASGYCHAFGTKLAEPKNADINNFLKSEILQIGTVDLYYVGISDMLEENVWVLASSITPVTFTDWNPGEPNDDPSKGTQDCVALNFGIAGRWIDHYCTEQHRYICQRDISGRNGGVDVIG